MLKITLMACNGLCEKYKVGKPTSDYIGRYAAGQKRCAICEIYLIWDGVSCPCCNFTLRTKPRNTINRQQLQQFNMMKRI